MRGGILAALVIASACTGHLELGHGVRACGGGYLRGAGGLCRPAVDTVDLGGLPATPAVTATGVGYSVAVGPYVREVWLHIVSPAAVSIDVDGVSHPVDSTGEVVVVVGVTTGAVTLLVHGATGDTASVTLTFDRSPRPALGFYVKAPLPDGLDAFGTSADLGDRYLVVGAPNEDSGAGFRSPDPGDANAPDAGAAYVFRLDSGRLVPETFLKADAPHAQEAFGRSVAIDGTRIAVGAPGRLSSTGAQRAGAVYVFERAPTGWVLAETVTASWSDGGDEFGASVDLDGDTLVVGAPGEASATHDPTDDNAPSAGAVYVYEHTDTGFAETQYLKAPVIDGGDRFGARVSLANGVLVVGAPGEDGNGVRTTGDPLDDSATDAGAAFAYRTSPTGFAIAAYLKGDFAGTGDAFGSAVATDGTRVLVGAPGDDRHGTEPLGAPPFDGTVNNTGAVSIFTAIGVSYAHEATLHAPYVLPYLKFGSAVAIDGVLAVVGMPGDFTAGSGIDPVDTSTGAAESGAVVTWVFDGTAWARGSVFRTPAYDPVTSTFDRLGDAVSVNRGLVLGASPYEDGRSAGVGGDPALRGLQQSGCAFVWR